MCSRSQAPQAADGRPPDSAMPSTSVPAGTRRTSASSRPTSRAQPPSTWSTTSIGSTQGGARGGGRAAAVTMHDASPTQSVSPSPPSARPPRRSIRRRPASRPAPTESTALWGSLRPDTRIELMGTPPPGRTPCAVRMPTVDRFEIDWLDPARAVPMSRIRATGGTALRHRRPIATPPSGCPCGTHP